MTNTAVEGIASSSDKRGKVPLSDPPQVASSETHEVHPRVDGGGDEVFPVAVTQQQFHDDQEEFIASFFKVHNGDQATRRPHMMCSISGRRFKIPLFGARGDRDELIR